jgi:serine/threonine protein kinase
MEHSWGSYVPESLIGTGGFAVVYRARHKIASTFVAIKVISKAGIRDESHRKRLSREIVILKQLNHPFIAKSFFIQDDVECVAIGQEYVPAGTLMDLLLAGGALPETQLKYYFLQIVSAIDYLHNVKRVAHRDLKLENVMLDSYHNVKLIDFGLGHEFSESEREFTTICGSPPYLAPELIATGRSSPAADIWSLGVILYLLAVGKFPFPDRDLRILYHEITTCEIQYPAFISTGLHDLLKGMLCRDVSRRFTIDAIIAHPWFPIQLYRTVTGLVNELDDRQGPDIDSAIVDLMTSKGIDCSNLPEVLAAGEENDLTTLYSVYARERLCVEVNHVLRGSVSNLTNPYFRKSCPLTSSQLAARIQDQAGRGVLKKRDSSEQDSSREKKIVLRPALMQVAARRGRRARVNLSCSPPALGRSGFME